MLCTTAGLKMGLASTVVLAAVAALALPSLASARRATVQFEITGLPKHQYTTADVTIDGRPAHFWAARARTYTFRGAPGSWAVDAGDVRIERSGGRWRRGDGAYGRGKQFRARAGHVSHVRIRYRRRAMPKPIRGARQVVVGYDYYAGARDETAFACAVIRHAAKCWGSNRYRRLGRARGAYRERPVTVLRSGVKQISASEWRACALMTHGRVKCWGKGPLGDGTNRRSARPVTVIRSGAVQVSVGDSFHSCARMRSGALKCWGFGPLGDGSENASLTPVTVIDSGVRYVDAGRFVPCVIVAHGVVKCWDWEYGNKPVKIASGARYIADGCGVFARGAVKCWGEVWSVSGDSSSLRERKRPVSMHIRGATEIASGKWNWCAVVHGAVKCWGAGEYGALGDGRPDNPRNRSARHAAVPIRSGARHVSIAGYTACAVVRRTLKCWGSDSNGQLGDAIGLDAPFPVNPAQGH